MLQSKVGNDRELAALHARLALDVLQRRAFESVGQVSANALVTRFPARAALFLNSLAGLRIGVVVLANLVELDFGENLQAIVPDGVAQRIEAVHADAVGIPAADEPDAVGLFAAPGAVVEQHADDFIVFVQVDMGNFALRAAHGAGVDLIAPAQQFGDLLGEGAVDIVLIHDGTSSQFQSQAKSIM